MRYYLWRINEALSSKTATVIAFVIALIGCILSDIAVAYHMKKTCPTQGLDVSDRVGDYTIKSIANKKQVYASLPNDNAEYLLTVRMKDLSVLEIVAGVMVTDSNSSKWREITNVEIVNP